MKRKITLVLTVIIAIALIITGCGQKSAPIPASQAQATGPAVPYINDNLLIGADWLKDNMSNVIILDSRDDKSYGAKHIAGAIRVTWQEFTDMEGKKPGDKGWGTLLAPEKLSAAIARLGIDNAKTVVVYGASPEGWGEDGRIAWTLEMAGLKNVKILNGGWAAWLAKGYAVDANVPSPTASSFVIASMDESLNTTTDYINQNLSSIKLIDTRDPKEYAGATKYGEKRGGHLPNAINITWNQVFNADGTVKDQKALEAMFSAAGISKNDEIVTYCTKGIRSAHMALILRMAGYEKAKNYDASFYEWSGNDSLNIVK